MTDWQLSEEEKGLESALRSEVASSQPEFSASLHDRIMTAVREESSAEVSTASVSPRGSRSWRYLLAAAASVALLVTGVLLLTGDEDPFVADPSKSSAEADSIASSDAPSSDQSTASSTDFAEPGVIDAVLQVAEELLLADASLATESGDGATTEPGDAEDASPEDAAIAATDLDSPAEDQWESIAHDVEVLTTVLFDPLGSDEFGDFESNSSL